MDCFAVSAFEDNTELVLETGYCTPDCECFGVEDGGAVLSVRAGGGRFTLVVVLLRFPDGFSLFGVVVCVFLVGWFCVGVFFVCFCCLCCAVVLLIHLH